MIDDNMGLEVDTDFDDEASLSCDFETEFDAYETEVDNKVWINELIKDINLGD